MSDAQYQRRIAELLARLEAIEHNEARLAERMSIAMRECAKIVISAQRLSRHFPDVLVRDIGASDWVLRPLDKEKRLLWEAQRRAFASHDIPTLNEAGSRASSDAADNDQERGRISDRTSAARRARRVETLPEEPAKGWRRLLDRFRYRKSRDVVTTTTFAEVVDQREPLEEARRRAEERAASVNDGATKLRSLEERVGALGRRLER
jgi:hypothetical protein